LKITIDSKYSNWLRIEGADVADAGEVARSAAAATAAALGLPSRKVVRTVRYSDPPVIDIRVSSPVANLMEKPADAIAADHRGRGRPVDVEERNKWTSGERAKMRGKHAGRLRFNPASMRD